MRCAKAKERLGAFLDAQMSESAAEELRRHVESCASCQRELQALRGVESFLAGALAPPEFPGFAGRVAAEAAARRAAGARQPGILALLRLDAYVRAAAAFGCAAGLALGILMGAVTARSSANGGDMQGLPAPADELGLGHLGEAPAGSVAEAYFSALAGAEVTEGGSR